MPTRRKEHGMDSYEAEIFGLSKGSLLDASNVRTVRGHEITAAWSLVGLSVFLRYQRVSKV